MSTATLTSKGQITLPKEIREHFHLSEGDRVEFLIAEGGEVLLRPVTSSIRRLFGIVHRPGVPAPAPEEIDQAIGTYLAAEDERIQRGEE